MNTRKQERKEKLGCISLINSENRKCQTAPKDIAILLFFKYLFSFCHFTFFNKRYKVD